MTAFVMVSINLVIAICFVTYFQIQRELVRNGLNVCNDGHVGSVLM